MDLEKIQQRIAETLHDPAGYKRMLAGLPVEMPDGYIFARQKEGAKRLAAFNAIPDEEFSERAAFLMENLGKCGRAMIKSPVLWEYGTHIELGAGVFINANCTFLDSNIVSIGDNTAVGPGVMFLGAGHPVAAADRDILDPGGVRTGVINICKPITVGQQCWIGGGAIIMGGVTIGDRTMVGAGAVVTKSQPSDVLVGGNPARVIREIKPGDGMP